MKQRLSNILRANGFHTDAGEKVADGEAYQLGSDDPDVALAMIVLDEDMLAPQGDRKRAIHLPIDIIILVKPDLSDVRGSIEDAIEDVRRAVEGDGENDRMLGGILANTLRLGPIRTLPRDSGTSTAGATLPYSLPISDGYGVNP
jgi:hypothetical protein